MANRYSKALKHLKNKNIDEKLKLLEQIPTNNTGGLYLDIPGETIIPPPVQILPRAADLAEDGDGAEGYTGNDTTGLFLDDGTILIEEPPGDTSYILGPMISMWYAWANYTQIGYVRQSDRKMVNLGRITGEMSAWDGETGFTGYGQLSIEQAVWYKGQTRADYRAFYPGPPSNEPDQYGRYIGSIISVAKPTTRNPPPYKGDDTNRGFDATDDHSLAMDNLGGWVAAAAILGFVGKTALDFYQWWNRQNEEMKQKLRDLVNPPEYSKEIQYQNIAGLRPDGTQGPNRLGDTNRGHDGILRKLVPRTLPDGTPAGYNIWSPVRQAGGGGNNMFAHHEPKGLVLTESRKKILRDIKKPIEVKEMPTKFKVKPTGRKNKSVGVDMMKIPDVPKQYKPQMNIWGKADYAANVRASQEKKNEVLELVGAAEHHWTYLTEDRRKKHQEKVNEMMSVEYDKQMELLYEKHRIKENKLNKAISAFKKPTDIAPEYPKEPPPQLDPQTGMHPKFGKNYKHDKLDPQSAEAMPSTGNPEIDANVKKAMNTKAKARKLKILLGNRKKISESMTTASLMSTTLPAQGDVDLGDITDPIYSQSSPGSSQSGNTYTCGAASAGTPPEVNGAFGMNIDTSEFDTLVFELSPGTIDSFNVLTPITNYPQSTSAGTKVISLKSVDRKKITAFAFSFSQSSSGSIGINVVRNLRFQRRTPMNVFVSLDSPEATNFIRTDPVMKGLSAEDRKKKLLDMLDAGDEYLLKYLGMAGSKARPSDTTMPDSWEQASETQSSPKNSTEKFADENGLPRDYQDRLAAANAYVQDNLVFLPRKSGLRISGGGTDGNPSRDLRKKSFEMQGFTSDQIDTIEKMAADNWTPYSSPTYNPEPEPKSSNNSPGLTNTDNPYNRNGYRNRPTGRDQSSPEIPSKSNPFMNIRLADKSNTSNTSTSSGVKDYGNIAAAGVPRNTGGSSSGDPNNIQWPRDKYPNKKAPAGPGARTANVPGTTDYGNIAATYGGQSAADQKAVDAWKKKNLIPGRGQNPYRPGTKKLFNPQTGMNLSAHHEPEGEVLSEKKSFKDLTKKIPGYYDGKPAPLGFPMQEPPKMKNGFHPDLVDGKKVSDRFNRLDPQSAKAMPPTGNPHIDKKVRAAAKKPK